MDEIKQKINSLIELEDKFNPLTDNEIAEQIGCKRSYITRIRFNMGIEDSRIRFKEAVTKEILKIINENVNIDIQAIHEILVSHGVNISIYHIKQIMGTLDEDYEIVDKEEDVFKSIIGSKQSLENCIKLAKSAILYPPNGLHTLIIGESGVGKSLLAQKMFEFGLMKGKFKPDMKMVTFNCADYSENPQLLLSQLFGAKKGAYTGADASHPGFIERADGGVLFLDEIHRMSPEGQEILFSVIDYGKYRRLGETEVERNINVLIIAATTEAPEKYLLDTFLRRIPMLIKIPPLRDRSLDEKIDLIKNCFSVQAKKTAKKIKIQRDAFVSFILYNPKGNIGKVNNEIQVSVAKAYLSALSHSQNELFVGMDNLSNEVKSSLLNIKQYRKELDEIVPIEGVVISENSVREKLSAKLTTGRESKSIFEYIDEKYNEMVNNQDDKSIINHTILDDIEKKIRSDISFENKEVNRKQLIEVIGSELIKVIEDSIRYCSLEAKIDSRLFYSISLHIFEVINRINSNRYIISPNIGQVELKYPEEYFYAKEMLRYISGQYNIRFPNEEVGIIALYLRSLTDYSDHENAIGILVITHGRVAGELVKISETLVGTENVMSLEMEMKDNPESILNIASEKIIELNKGKGVLLLVDMGSLTSFGYILQESLKIPIRTLDRVEINLLIEAIRISKRKDMTLDDLFLELKNLQCYKEENQNVTLKKLLIITVCLTGLGTSLYLKELINSTINDINVEVISLGILGKEGFSEIVKRIKVDYDILAIVGTVNPAIYNIPYIPISEVIEGKLSQKIRYLLEQKMPRAIIKFDKRLIFHSKKFNSKDEIICYLCNKMHELKYVNSDYKNGVLEREKMGSTNMIDSTGQGIAILHTQFTKDILKPGIALMTLKEKMFWGDINVDVIFVMATNNDSRDIVEKFNREVFHNQLFMKTIRDSKGKDEIEDIFKKLF